MSAGNQLTFPCDKQEEYTQGGERHLDKYPWLTNAINANYVSRLLTGSRCFLRLLRVHCEGNGTVTRDKCNQ